jgi:hypothetical protein
MNIQIIGGEEYEWSDGRKKNFAGLSWDDACNVLDTMNDEDAEKLGFTDGMDDLWILSTINISLKSEAFSSKNQ